MLEVLKLSQRAFFMLLEEEEVEEEGGGRRGGEGWCRPWVQEEDEGRGAIPAGGPGGGMTKRVPFLSGWCCGSSLPRPSARPVFLASVRWARWTGGVLLLRLTPVPLLRLARGEASFPGAGGQTPGSRPGPLVLVGALSRLLFRLMLTSRSRGWLRGAGTARSRHGLLILLLLC